MKRNEVRRIIDAKYADYCDRIVQLVKALPDEFRHSGDDSVLANIWEEFKYQVQRQESVLFDAYEDTITAICRELVQGLPEHEQALLWLTSEGYFNRDEADADCDKADDVVDELYRRVCTRATDENLKVDPDELNDEVEEQQ